MAIPKKTTKNTKDDHKNSLSVRRHGEKRVGKPVKRSTRTVASLPRELLVNVFARVASSSFTDPFNAKLCCKGFLEPASDDYIAQCISLDKFPITNWSPLSKQALAFLTHCFNKGNPESLFRQGMIDYFKLVNVESGLEHLKRAVEKEHPEATYVYGMILLSRGDDQSDQQGLSRLNSMNNSRSRCWNVGESRNKVGSILNHIWINNQLTLESVNTKCRKRDHATRIQRNCKL
ncbi:F-box protein At2g35280-like [Bidens hawaiensis]|uniref:F-box protein At2g35280-like n=1 Tax=Bidens hawaiensis TaxID=980011 RepID=UPI004049F522